MLGRVKSKPINAGAGISATQKSVSTLGAMIAAKYAERNNPSLSEHVKQSFRVYKCLIITLNANR